jgi:S-disulfanyl-L-cysteine oxidoreductase SoxD
MARREHVRARGVVVRAVLATLAASALVTGCKADSGRPATADGSRPNASAIELPAGHFALGRAPTPGELGAWDTDVGADGAALPPGRGSVGDGAALYRAQCASCHGARGEGMAPAFPALVGRDPRGETFDFASDPRIERTIGNYWPHATTLFDYIRRSMPLTSPGSLTDDETYALTAFLLAANDVIAGDAVLDAAALRAVRMPARDRFVDDDRPNGPGVR